MPGQVPERPTLSLGEVVREAASAYRDHWQALLVVALVVFVPIGVLEALAADLHEVESDDGLVVAEAAVAGSGAGWARSRAICPTSP